MTFSNLKLIVRGLVLAVLMLLQAACGGFSGYISATDEDIKVVHAGGISEAAMAQIAIVQNPDFNGGKISLKALRKIQEYSISCQRQLDPQQAGPGQSGVNGALPYGVAGLGTGPAAAAAGFTGAVVTMGDYALYGGGAYLLPGGVNGLFTGSFSLASTKGTCTRDFWGDVSKTDPDFKGTHVEVVYYGKAWGNSTPPALDKTATTPALKKK